MNQWLLKLSQTNNQVAIVDRQWKISNQNHFYDYYVQLENGLKNNRVLKLSPFYLAKLLTSKVSLDQINNLFNHLATLKTHYQNVTPAAAKTLFKQIQQLFQITNHNKYYPINGLINQIENLLHHRPLNLHLPATKTTIEWDFD